MSTDRVFTGLSSEMAEVLDKLSEWEDLRQDQAEQLLTVRALLKTAQEDLAAERARFPVCQCCGGPLPTAGMLDIMQRESEATPTLRQLVGADALALWERGFCSSPCEADYAAAGPSEPGRCRTRGCGDPPERDGLCHDCLSGKSEDEAEARKEAERGEL